MKKTISLNTSIRNDLQLNYFDGLTLFKLTVATVRSYYPSCAVSPPIHPQQRRCAKETPPNDESIFQEPVIYRKSRKRHGRTSYGVLSSVLRMVLLRRFVWFICCLLFLLDLDGFITVAHSRSIAICFIQIAMLILFALGAISYYLPSRVECWISIWCLFKCSEETSSTVPGFHIEHKK